MSSPTLLLKHPGEIVLATQEHIHIPDKPPAIVLIVGPCRVGTTALSNIFARLGVPAYMQPIKSMRRAVEIGEPVVDWDVDPYASLVVSKETLGPKTEAEFFDPVEELIRIGYPKKKIDIVGICREPRSTLASWANMWGEVSLQGFLKSFQLLNQIMDRAERAGVRSTYYVHEAISTNEPAEVIGRLLERLNVKLIENVHLPKEERLDDLVDWRGGEIFGNPDSKIVFFDNPPQRFIKGVREGKGYRFRLLVAKLTEEQETALKENGIYDIYERFTDKCERNLKIKILERR